MTDTHCQNSSSFFNGFWNSNPSRSAFLRSVGLSPKPGPDAMGYWTGQFLPGSGAFSRECAYYEGGIPAPLTVALAMREPWEDGRPSRLKIQCPHCGWWIAFGQIKAHYGNKRCCQDATNATNKDFLSH